MVDFVHPFPGKNPGDPLTEQEIIRAIRLAICAEHEATQLYNVIAEYVEDENIKKIMVDVADEEQVHIGEFQKLLEMYEKDEQEKVDEGKQEALEKLSSKLSKVISDEETEHILRLLFGGNPKHLCEIQQHSKEWNSLEYALQRYKKENKVSNSKTKKAMNQKDVVETIEQFLNDPKNQCNISNLREAIGEVWEFMEKKVYSNTSLASLKKLAYELEQFKS